MITKTIDNKGRLLLGKEYAGRLVIVDDAEPDRLIIQTATPIPDRELWLYRNQEALASVQRGLEQAKERKLGPGPDMKAAAALAAEIDE
jgi:hypothetical protein